MRRATHSRKDTKRTRKEIDYGSTATHPSPAFGIRRRHFIRIEPRTVWRQKKSSRMDCVQCTAACAAWTGVGRGAHGSKGERGTVDFGSGHRLGDREQPVGQEFNA